MRYRLRSSLEPFAAPDETLLLVDAGSRARLAVRDPAAWERRLLEALDGPPRSGAELQSVTGAPDLASALDALRRAGALVEGRSTTDDRFARQGMYFADETGDLDTAAQAQRRLGAATVAVVGCGGLGSWTAAALACAGIGTLILVDDDVVELGNLNRQVLFRHTDIGRPKVQAAAEALTAFSPELEVRPLQLRIRGQADARAALAGAQVAVETADWPPYELSRWLDRACRELGIAHTSAAQRPPLIRVGPFRTPGASQCLDCWENAVRERFPLYDALAEQRIRRPRAAPTVGFAAAAVGAVLAAEIVHLVTGIAEPATLRGAWMLDLQTLETRWERCDPEPCGCA